MTPPDNICAKSLQLSKSDGGLKCENILQTLSPPFKMTIKQNLHDIVEYCSRASSLAYNNYTQLSTFVDDLFMFNSILVSNCSNGWWKVQICAINIASFYNYIYKILYYVSCLNILNFNVINYIPKLKCIFVRSLKRFEFWLAHEILVTAQRPNSPFSLD